MDKEKPRFFVITGNSGSGKTFLTEELLRNGIEEAISFTTREIRNDAELDRYVFITEEQFEEKERLGHFLEAIKYDNSSYALSKYLPNKTCFSIVEPNGREQILKADIKTHEVITIFIDTDEKVLKRRLKKRDGHTNRLGDNFTPTENCLLLNGTDKPKTNLKILLA